MPSFFTGTFTFNVSEVVPAGVDEQSPTADGITYDTHVGTLTVTVTDLDENGKHTGKLTATAKFDEGAFAFENSYNAEPATFSIDDHWDFQKVIDGRDWLDTDSFRFLIAASGDTPLPETGVESTDPRGRIITLENQGGTADGSPVSFDFGTVSFDFDDMKTGATVAPDGSRSKTFTYNISELNTAPGIAGMSNSGARYQVTLTVTDDNTGTLEVTDYRNFPSYMLDLDPNLAVATAIPFALLGQYGVTLFFTLRAPLLEFFRSAAEKADTKAITKWTIVSEIILGLIFAVIVTLFFIGGLAVGQQIVDAIPAWLNDAAMAQGINFSRVLQDALKAQLHIG